ncbi:MAG: dephospho-CoA kinase [Chlamydiia bacterium]|nr:dephospho-CoA kinase [Chlamydiia bacterium]
MLALIRIAITGGLSSGKSSVCQILQECGAYVVDADKIIHELLNPNTTLGQHIVKLLGEECVTGDTFDRQAIAAKVFSDSTLLTKLENHLYPYLRREIKRHEEQAKQRQSPCFVVEIPLLFEKGFDSAFDTTIAVYAPQEVSINRFIAKAKSTSQDFYRRMKTQFSPEEKMAKAAHVIDNSGSKEQLKHHVESLYTLLTQGKQ